MTFPVPLADLSAIVLPALRKIFFKENGTPIEFYLADKKTAQNDPLDAYIRSALQTEFEPQGIFVEDSIKPNVSPDIVIYRKQELLAAASPKLQARTDVILAIEVKAVRCEYVDKKGVLSRKSPRTSDMDFNSTPPCHTITLTEKSGTKISVSCFYLFIVLAPIIQDNDIVRGHWTVESLVLADGATISQDEVLYAEITGIRTKEIGIGTFADGAKRRRPMLVFCVPLADKELTAKPVLIHSKNLSNTASGGLTKISWYDRVIPAKLATAALISSQTFHCYWTTDDVHETFKKAKEIKPPFSSPKRSAKTSQRGRFTLSLGLQFESKVAEEQAVPIFD